MGLRVDGRVFSVGATAAMAAEAVLGG